MAYQLGSITLPRPRQFRREQIEHSSIIVTLDGTQKKDITNRKERFILNFTNLTQSEVSSILSEYNLQTTRNFVVSETNLTINSTPVHVDIRSRQYNTLGSEYREDMVLILTEVI